MRKKLCLTLCVLTLSVVLTACGGAETETVQSESTTEEVVVETTEEVTEESVEETTEDATEEVVAEPLYDYTDEVAFQVSQDMYMVDGIASIDIKTITDFTVVPSEDTLYETGEPAYYMYQTADGTTLKFDVDAEWNINTETSTTYTNADGAEIIYVDNEYREFLYMPLNRYEDKYGMYIRIIITPGDVENFNIEDYLEITRSCYYIINEEVED